MAWACATLDVQSPQFFSELERNSRRLVVEGNHHRHHHPHHPQSVSNIAWACATLGVPAPLFFAQIEEHSDEILLCADHGTVQYMANILWAVSKFQYHCPSLLESTEKYSNRLVESGNLQSISNAALALAKLGYDYPKTFFDSLCKEIMVQVEHESNNNNNNKEQHIINLCYAFAILDLMTRSEYEEKFRKLWSMAVRFDVQKLSVEEKSQLSLVFAFATASGMELAEPSPTSCSESADTNTRPFRHENLQSSAQKEVSLILNDLGFDHDEEVSPFLQKDYECPFSFSSEMLAIDMACRKQMVAVEFDGPFHFLRAVGSGKVLELENGATKAKRRFLERLGWKVVNIRYFDWMTAKNKQEKKALVLRAMVNNTAPQKQIR
jgi:hypothetical protein